jgi:hypothetical protein
MKNTNYSHVDISAVFSDKKSLLLCIEGIKDFSEHPHEVTLSKASTGQVPLRKSLENKKSLKLIRNKEATLTGTLLGSIIGIFLGYGFGEGLIPGFENFSKFGPIPTAIIGWAIFGVVGTWIGDWVGEKMPEYEIRKFIKKLKPKDILLSVHLDDPNERIQTLKLLRKLGAKEISTEKGHQYEHWSDTGR